MLLAVRQIEQRARGGIEPLALGKLAARGGVVPPLLGGLGVAEQGLRGRGVLALGEGDGGEQDDERQARSSDKSHAHGWRAARFAITKCRNYRAMLQTPPPTESVQYADVESIAA